MKKLYLTAILFLCILPIIAKERTKAFELIIPESLVENSLYNKLEYLDCRIHKEDLGFVQTSIMNNQTKVIEETPLATQLNTIINNIVTETAKDKTMLFQLRNIYFSEITKSTSETGFCHIRISLFEKNGSEYSFISTLDTLVSVKAMDVTNKLLKSASQVITSFLSDNLRKNPTEEQPYLLTDIRNIDYYEKNNLKFYSTDTYTDGIYYNFRSLANQTPEISELYPKFDKNNNLKEIKITNEEAKQKKVKPKEIYAVIVNEQPYIATPKGYIPIYKEGEEFKFINDGNIKINMEAYIGASLAAGLVGALFGYMVFVSPTTTQEKVVMQIDHLNGKFVLIPKETEKAH